MKKIAFWVLSLIIFVGAHAEPKKLLLNKNYLTGTWQGQGWLMKDNRKVDFMAASKVKFAAEKQILVDESLGFMVDTIKKDSTIIYNPLVVIQSDTITKKIRAWMYTEGLPGIEVVVKDSSANFLTFTYKSNNKFYKYTEDCIVPNFRTVKLYNSIDEKVWSQVMEIQYTKSSKFIGIPTMTKLDSNMSKINFATGNWFGTGNFYTNGKKNTFTMVEQVEPKNLGGLYKIEGKSMSIDKDTAAKSINSKILSNYYGILFYNISTKKYYVQYFYSDGRNTISPLNVNTKEKTIQWDVLQGTTKLTQKVDYKVSGQRNEQLLYVNPKTNANEIIMDITLKQSSGIKSGTNKGIIKPMPVPVPEKE